MKQFFKYVFATMVGLLLSFFVLFLIMFFMIMGLAASFEKKETKVTANSVLELNLGYDIPERAAENPFEEIFSSDDNDIMLGLDRILANIEKAKTDDNIKGILLRTDVNGSGFATLEEIRDALADFKKSGKFIYAYAPMYDEKNYFLASVADSVFLAKTGEVMFNGIAANLAFFKGSLDKLGIEMDLIKVGKYKGAGESFTRDNISEENKEQITRYLNGIYSRIMLQIATSRHKDTGALIKTFNHFDIQSGKQAIAYGLIDRMVYEDEIISALKTKTGIKPDNDLKLVSCGKYDNAKIHKKEEKATKDKIAVIYAVGDIVEGEGDEQMVGSKTLCKAISKAREDKNVKAIVLRINSPGGSASASDQIWREVSLCKGKKPVIVSMGDVAASGGYYIAASADSIIAMPTTITGSIGVFGLVPNMHGLLHDKLGMSFESVKTGEYSDFGRADRPMSEYERQIVQNVVNRIYDEFTGVVEKGRKLDSASVESIAQGHVWIAGDAITHKLVDSYGGINDAIKIAAFKAKIKDYRVINYPKPENPFNKLFNNVSTKVSEEVKMKELGDFYPYYQQLQMMSRVKGVQMRMPFMMEWN